MGMQVNPASEQPAIPYEAAPIFREDHAEGRVTRVIEQQAAKLPSGLFLVASLSAMVASLSLELLGRRRASQFVGLWPGPLLSMGIYTKMVKVLGAR